MFTTISGSAIPHSLCKDAKNLKWRPIQKYPNASESDLSELITEISDPRSAQLQTFLMVARLSPLTLSASEASYRQVKKPDLFLHISLLSARLAPHSKQLQRQESHQTIRSCAKNCTDPTTRNVQTHLVSVTMQFHVQVPTMPCCSGHVCTCDYRLEA